MNRVLYNAIVISILVVVLFGAPSIYLTAEGAKTLISGKNTHGEAEIIWSIESQELYGKCLLTIRYSPHGWNEPVQKNISLSCMPHGVGKKVQICYNLWKPDEVVINDWQLTGDLSVCSHLSHSAAMECLWVALLLVSIAISMLAFIWTIGAQHYRYHKKNKRDAMETL